MIKSYFLVLVLITCCFVVGGGTFADEQPASIYDKLELKNGDVIQEVNGENVNDPQRALEVMGNLKTNPKQFKIVREGAEQTVDESGYDNNSAPGEDTQTQ